MSIENGKCLNCGGPLILNDSYIKATCKYCNSEIVIKESIEKLSEGLLQYEHLCLLAEQAIEFDEDYDKARNLYREALIYNPNDYRILWGLFMCEVDCILYYKYFKGFVQVPGDLLSCYQKAERQYGYKAYLAAPNEVKQYYSSVMQSLPASIIEKRKKK